jgi:general secretion pathway protein A
MYEQFYGLRERPFDLTPNPRFLYLTGGHSEALSNLQYGIAGRKGITLLIGEAGTGKTTLVRAALDAVAGPLVNCVYLSNPVLTRQEFYEFLAPKFGLTERAAGSKAWFLAELEDSVLARHRSGGVTALVIDEAQSLPHDLLEEVRLLANFETATDKLLPVVLAGQPELAARLEHEDLRQLKQRIALRCDLAALDIRETAAYISGRVSIAGGDSAAIFTRAAVQTVYERSRGIPRTISVICDNALLTGFAAGEKPIGSNLVLEVCRDFRLPAFKFTELQTTGEAPAWGQDTAATAAGAVTPRNGDGPATGRPRPPAAEPDEDPAGPRDGRSGTQSSTPDAGLFSHYTRKKRFSFFG